MSVGAGLLVASFLLFLFTISEVRDNLQADFEGSVRDYEFLLENQNSPIVSQILETRFSLIQADQKVLDTMTWISKFLLVLGGIIFFWGYARFRLSYEKKEN